MLVIPTHNQKTSTRVTDSHSQDFPFSNELVTISRQEWIHLNATVNQYKSLHQRAQLKVKELNEELKQEKSKVRDLNHRLYGKKTEKSATKPNAIPLSDEFIGPLAPRPKRGAKKGRANRPRRKQENLSIEEEIVVIPDEQLCCPECGETYQAFPKTEDSDIIEIHVNAHVRRVKREQAKASCHCPNRPALLTAPVAPRVYPKARYGVSVWVFILLDKYQSYTPSNRLYQRLEDQGVSLSAGTVTNGLKKIAPLFSPIQQAMQTQQAKEMLFHNDETMWKVFEAVEGKIGYKWYLWVTRSASVVSFTVATGRSTQVIEDNFKSHQTESIIIVCDRYAAYKKFARDNPDFVTLAFCWAHVRRDFLDAARSNPEDEAWMFNWVREIGALYHLNQQRLECWDKSLSLAKQTAVFNQCHQALTQAVNQLEQKMHLARANEAPTQGELKTKRFKVIDSLSNHWEGLRVFVENPQVPMDNNLAEQALRMPVAGRRSFYGSGAIWSAEFASVLMGWIKTLQVWKINPYTWFYTYLQACAENGSESPKELALFLPWEITAERMAYFRAPYSGSMG
jgi:transposase